MKKLKISITGCLGRMGQQTIKSANKNRNINIVTLTENKKTNKKISNILPQKNSKGAFKTTSVIIDF